MYKMSQDSKHWLPKEETFDSGWSEKASWKSKFVSLKHLKEEEQVWQGKDVGCRVTIMPHTVTGVGCPWWAKVTVIPSEFNAA